jgi:superfamily II DNA or RNA helicase
METLFKLARDMAEPKTWSAGVELARNGIFQEEGSSSSEERTFRVAQGPRDKVVSVSISEANELWQCSCSAEEDPCRHIVATIIAVKQGRLEKSSSTTSLSGVGVITHEFKRNGNALEFSRYISFSASERVNIVTTLLQSVASIERSGRKVFATEEELRVDYALPHQKAGLLDPKTMRHLIPTLARVSNVILDGNRIGVRAEALIIKAEVIDEASGYRLRRSSESIITEYFSNSAALVDGVLHAVEDSALRMEELALIKDLGSFFSEDRAMDLVTVVLPRLHGKIDVRVLSKKLPRARRVAPRIIIDLRAVNDGASLAVVPTLIYGDPEIARVEHGDLRLVDRREVPIREVAEEGRLLRDLSLKLGLKTNQATIVAGERALDFIGRLRGFSISGDGAQFFKPRGVLTPKLDMVGDSLGFSFVLPGAEAKNSELNANEVLSAWKRGDSFINLGADAGWGALPQEWLREHSAALERILEAKEDSAVTAPAKFISDVSELCDSIGVAPPQYFTRLKQALADVQSIPNVDLPSDLAATLRSYQRVGVNWLSFLLQNGLGALLADDMGLGKTLQALCVAGPRTLVVCPTSVLGSWKSQIERFRPTLTVSVYHGARRELERDADITITSYALLRRDVDLLVDSDWDLVVLDEAQMIRNPESQVAQAAHRIKAKKKISLSGTPVENSLDDLWSQFKFLNPGLLGSYREFQDRFATPIQNGELLQAAELRKRVMPFVLRRLKKDVATELPPKTEVILECELSESEKIVYQAVLGAVKSQVDQLLAGGGGVFSALEALLRLRQVSCHLGLLPGHSEVVSSSKVDLLMESLVASKAQGHRALVFSQWTTMLDLIEPHLDKSGMSFSRIDGSTEGRGDIVDSFQAEDGPDVMLLSLKAGGLGLTLTAADHVYIIDPWWNPAAEDQAADRAYRIGQKNSVIVHRLVTKDTVEERILKIQDEKRALLAAALGGDGSFSLSRDELLSLLA